MSELNRDELIKVVADVQGHLCSYHMPGKPEPSGFCDCKYGAKGLVHSPDRGPHGGEQTGCPEMREVLAILEAMTDKEFERIQKRRLAIQRRKAREYVKQMKREGKEPFMGNV